jgi:hypothetical protein
MAVIEAVRRIHSTLHASQTPRRVSIRGACTKTGEDVLDVYKWGTVTFFVYPGFVPATRFQYDGTRGDRRAPLAMCARCCRILTTPQTGACCIVGTLSGEMTFIYRSLVDLLRWLRAHPKGATPCRGGPTRQSTRRAPQHQRVRPSGPTCSASLDILTAPFEVAKTTPDALASAPRLAWPRPRACGAIFDARFPNWALKMRSGASTSYLDSLDDDDFP